MENERLKTGTTTVGVKCKDGIILGADRRATAGNYIANKHVDKIFQISDNLAITMAGSVSDAQLLTKLIKAELRLKDLKANRNSTVKEAANLLGGMVYRNVRQMSMIPGVSHFLLGGKDNSGYHLFDIFADGSVSDISDFVSSGSGSVIAWGVLETSYKADLNVVEAEKLVAKAINAALQRDSASGGGLTLLSITDKGVNTDTNKEISPDVSI